MNQRPTHPLKCWRETQLVKDARSGKMRPMGIADAARAIEVPYQTWMNWEKYPGEPGARIPTTENMEKILQLTNLQVRPDHFYDLRGLRAARRSSEAAASVAHDGAPAKDRAA